MAENAEIKLEIGDILTFGNNPQKVKVVGIEGDDPANVRAYRIVPIDDDGNELPLVPIGPNVIWNSPPKE